MLAKSFLSACSPSSLCISVVALLLQSDRLAAADSYQENPGPEGNGALKIGPEYKIDPDLTDRGNPQGKSFEFFMPLAESKIFKGDDTTLNPEKKPVNKTRK